MNSDLHARAQKLIAQERVEGISREEQCWLAAHLSECAECSAIAHQTLQALATLRGVPVELPRNLVSRTQLRVRLRAEELREREPGRKLLWVLTFLSWALGVSTAPFVWRAFEWIGQWANLPKPVWQMGVLLWWAVPALIAAGAVLLGRKNEAANFD